jgi:hypothetical protein
MIKINLLLHFQWPQQLFNVINFGWLTIKDTNANAIWIIILGIGIEIRIGF